MKIVSSNNLEVYQFESTVFTDCIHGIFSRHGGVSSTPWNTLNMGGTVGDERSNVIENRKRAFDFFNREVKSIFDVWQVHSTTAICTNSPRGLDATHEKADAIFTNDPKITLFMRFADCVPIMIFDPISKVVGIIHAGWQGTVNHIVSEAINSIKKKYGVDPANIVAGIGPSIGPDHYLIGEEVRQQVENKFNICHRDLLEVREGKTHFDLWKANEFLLREQGVKSIETARICTACHIEDWYSHRAEKGTTGRFGALIAIKEQGCNGFD
jgi:polyphenol oxidase